jgi:hypothetical protein
MMPRNILRIFSIVALTAFVGASPLAAQTKPKVLDSGIAQPASTIFIGNSFFYYNNGINGHLTALLRSADAAYKFRATMVTISGSGTDWHDVDSYFRPNAIGKYSFGRQTTNIVFNKFDRLFGPGRPVDCSQCPVHPELENRVRRLQQKAQRHCAQASALGPCSSCRGLMPIDPR